MIFFTSSIHAIRSMAGPRFWKTLYHAGAAEAEKNIPASDEIRLQKRAAPFGGAALYALIVW